MPVDPDSAPLVILTPLQTLKHLAAAPPIPMFTPRSAARVFNSVHCDANTPALTDVSLAPGCELIIRGVGAANKGSDTVAIVQKSINEICTSDSQLTNISLLVRKFSHCDPLSVWFSSCYVYLAKEFSPLSLSGTAAEPRVDLLEMWGKALIFRQKTPRVGSCMGTDDCQC